MNEISEQISQTLDYLCKHYDKSLDDKKIKLYIEKLENYKYDIQELQKLIKQRHRPTEIEVNTVGSYLWGCFQNYYGNDLNQNCSPLCYGSIFQTKETNNEKCQYSIWVYNDNKLENTFDTSSSKAYIYVDENWEGFRKRDIDKLKEKGILFASIFITFNSQHKNIISMTSIDDLPIIKEYFDIIVEKTSNAWYYWIVLLFIIIFIVMIYFKYSKT